MSRENVEVVRAFFAAWNARDMDAVREMRDPDAITRAPEGWPVVRTENPRGRPSLPPQIAGFQIAGRKGQPPNPPQARHTAPGAMSRETLAKLRRGYEAFNRGDASVAMDLATPDVEWGTTGTFPGLVGVYRGPEALARWMDSIRSAWEKFEVMPDEVVRDEGDILVVAELERGRGRGSGVEVEMRVFSVYSFREGKVRRRQAFTEREAALEAAGLRE